MEEEILRRSLKKNTQIIIISDHENLFWGLWGQSMGQSMKVLEILIGQTGGENSLMKKSW